MSLVGPCAGVSEPSPFARLETVSTDSHMEACMVCLEVPVRAVALNLSPLAAEWLVEEEDKRRVVTGLLGRAHAQDGWGPGMSFLTRLGVDGGPRLSAVLFFTTDGRYEAGVCAESELRWLPN